LKVIPGTQFLSSLCPLPIFHEAKHLFLHMLLFAGCSSLSQAQGAKQDELKPLKVRPKINPSSLKLFVRYSDTETKSKLMHYLPLFQTYPDQYLSFNLIKDRHQMSFKFPLPSTITLKPWPSLFLTNQYMVGATEFASH
jgi:hypothetical protein